MDLRERSVHPQVLLNKVAAAHLAKNKCLGCTSCRLFQYSPHFTRQDREEYRATLDPERRDRKNTSHRLAGVGPEDAEVMAVLDLPTVVEDKNGEAASGGASLIIPRNAAESGLDTTGWYFTHVVKCRDPLKRTKYQSGVYCSGFLGEEIQRVRPRVIVAFGPLAFQILTGRPTGDLAHFLCVPQEVKVAGHPCIVYPMMSPGYLRQHDYLMQRYLEHFDRLSAFLRGDKSEGVRCDRSRYVTITDVDEAIRVCREMITAATEKKRVIDMDIETSSLNPYKKGVRLCIVSMSCDVNRGYAITVNHDEAPWSEDDRRRFYKRGLKPLMTNPAVKLRWHNGKFDNKWFPRHCGFAPRDLTEDTMLTHYATNENMEHGLKPLANLFTDMGDYDRQLDQVLAQQTFEDRPRYDLVPLEIIGKYAAMDPVATRKLGKVFARHVEEQGEFVRALAYRALPAFSSTLTRVEDNGVAIDLPFAESSALPYCKAAADASYAKILSEPVVRQFIRDGEAAARAKMKKPKPIEVKQYFKFSLDSPKQLQTLLFDDRYYGHTPTIMSEKSGLPSTDKEVLNDLAQKQGSPIAAAITSHRLDEKLVSTYVEPIIRRCAEQDDNTMHGDFLLHGTVTGRLSSKNVNLQNIPNKGAGIIKRMYTSRYGDDGVFLQIDFSQIELRILAAVSNDPHMVGAYKAGKDLHTVAACMIFGMTEEEFKALPDKEQKRRRTIAKRVNFGTCLAEGTPVLTQRGWVPIESVYGEDLLWDGSDWVKHAGVVMTGTKEVIDIGGVWCTKEHEVLTDSGWVTAWQYAHDTRHRLSGTYSGDGRFNVSNTVYEAGYNTYMPPVPAAIAFALTVNPYITCSLENQPNALVAGSTLCTPPAARSSGIVRLSQTRTSVRAGSAGTVALCNDAMTQTAGHIATTAVVAYASTNHCKPAQISSVSSLPLTGGTRRDDNSTAWTTTLTTLQEIYGWPQPRRTWEIPAGPSLSHTAEPACAYPTFGAGTALPTEDYRLSWRRFAKGSTSTRSCKSSRSVEVRTARVYDILNAGPRNRFQAGGHIVHNCYGIGGPGIQSSLKSDGVDISEDEARGYLDTFFERYPRVTRWIERVENGTSDNECSLSLFGRRRRLEQVRSNFQDTVARALRQGVNHVIQSTAGDMTMTALCLFDQEVCIRRGDDPRLILPTIERREFPVDEKWKQVHTVLQVHDMIGVDCHKAIAGPVMERLLDTMQNVVDYAPLVWGDCVKKTLKPLKRVPIIAEPEVGPNWRDAIKVKTPEDIPRAMFVARKRKELCDADPKAEWGKTQEEVANGEWKRYSGKAV